MTRVFCTLSAALTLAVSVSGQTYTGNGWSVTINSVTALGSTGATLVASVTVNEWDFMSNWGLYTAEDGFNLLCGNCRIGAGDGSWEPGTKIYTWTLYWTAGRTNPKIHCQMWRNGDRGTWEHSLSVAPACTNDTTRGEDWVTGWVVGPTGSQLLNTWLTRERCISGAWVVETNSIWTVSGNTAYMATMACPGGQWQVRQPITGYSRDGNKLNLTLGPQETNPKSCGQYAAESVGLVWSNLTAAQQLALDQGSPVGQITVGLPGHSDGMSNTLMNLTGSNTLPAFVLSPSGAVATVSLSTNGSFGPVAIKTGTGQSTGSVQNTIATGGTVNLGNLADLAKAVSEGVYKGLTNAGVGSGSNVAFSPTFYSFDETNSFVVNTGFVDTVESILTNEVSALLTGVQQFASIGRLETWSMSPMVIGAGTPFQRTLSITIDFQNGYGRGISLFRTALLLGVTVCFFTLTMKTIREGIA